MHAAQMAEASAFIQRTRTLQNTPLQRTPHLRPQMVLIHSEVRPPSLNRGPP
jgi:hypothetical protein